MDEVAASASKEFASHYVLDPAANRKSETMVTTSSAATATTSKTYEYDGRGQLAAPRSEG